MEGLVLMMLYLIIAVSFWYYPVRPFFSNSKSKAALTNRDQIQLLYLDVVTSPDYFALLFSASEVDIRGQRCDIHENC